MQTGYINRDTAELVDALEQLIASRGDLRESLAVKDAMENFKRIAQTPPSIVDYVRNKIQSGETFTKEQVQLLMYATVARSSSTWGTIQAEAALLGLEGQHDTAAIINNNAMNETGDSHHRPHSLLLYDSIGVFADALGFPPLTPASYHLSRHIHMLCDEQNALTTPQAVEQALAKANIHIPHTPRDIETALHYCDITYPAIVDYHTRIERDVLKLGEGADAGKPHDAQWQAVRALELATREASSVDEHDTGKLSYIGTYGLLAASLINRVPHEQRAKATRWSEVHNDEAAGQEVGWEGAAEEGHARDARQFAVETLGKVNAPTFAAALNKVTELGNARLDYWNNVVTAAENGKLSVRHAPRFGKKDKMSYLQGAAVAGTTALSLLMPVGVGAHHARRTAQVERAEPETTTVVEMTGSKLDVRLPGALHRLFEESPASLNDPQIVARAAHGVELRTSKGKIDPDQTVFTYISQPEDGDAYAVAVTAENFLKEMEKLKGLFKAEHKAYLKRDAKPFYPDANMPSSGIY